MVGLPPSCCDLILDHAGISAACDKVDMACVAKVAEVSKSWLRSNAERFVREREDAPVAYVYGSDTTPLRTRQRVFLRVGDLLVVRSYRQTGDWLIQRGFLFDTRGHVCTVLPDPVKLVDKTHLSHFQAQRRFFPLCRSLGHRGIVVSHYVWDGAVKSSCERMTRRLHEAKNQQLKNELPEGQAYLLRLKSWELFALCVSHIVHNSQKWALRTWINKKEVTRDVWIVCESIINSKGLLLEHLDNWIAEVTHFEDAPYDVTELWELLGVVGDELKEFASMQIRWDGQRLCVAEDLRVDAQRNTRIKQAFLHVLRVRTFSSSRWCGVSETARCLVGASMLGLPDFLGKLLVEKSEKTFFLKGWNHFSAEVKHMMAVVVCSSPVPDAALQILQEDDRLVRILPQLRSDMALDLDYVVNLPDVVIRDIADAMGISALALRDESMEAAAVSAAHIESGIRQADGLPWRLALGDDIMDNLRSFCDEPWPADEVSKKIRELLDIGVDIREVAEGVSLLRDVPWSSKVVEQGHAAASRILRRHKTLGAKSTQARSTVVHLAPLVGPPSLSKGIDDCEARIAALLRKRPQGITGRHAFLGSLQELLKQQRDDGRDVPSDMGQKITARHGARWQAMSIEHRTTYEARAIELREERREEISTKIAELRVRLRRLRTNQEDNAAAAPPCVMRSCRLTAPERSALDALYLEPMWTAARVEALRAEALQPIGPPPAAEQAVFEAMPIQEPGAKQRLPHWAPWLANNRDELRGCVLRYTRPSGERSWFKFLYAMQSPIFFAVLALREEMAEEIDNVSFGENQDDFLEWSQIFYVRDWRVLFSDSAELDDTDATIDIVCSARFRAGGQVVCSGEFQPLDLLLLYGGWPEKGLAPDVTAPEEPVRLDDLPDWVEEELLWDPGEWDSFFRDTAKRRGRRPARDDDESSSGVDEAMGAEAEALVFDQLVAERARVRDEAVVVEGFRVLVRGGRWCMEQHGVPYDSYRAEAIPGTATDFCNMYHITKTATFSLRQYGEEDALVLANGWARRVQTFFAEWQQGRDFEVLPAVVESPEFIALAERAAGPTLVRLNAIRTIVPRL